MIAYSIIVLCTFIGCIVCPIVLAVSTAQSIENKSEVKSNDKTDTFFLRR